MSSEQMDELAVQELPVEQPRIRIPGWPIMQRLGRMLRALVVSCTWIYSLILCALVICWATPLASLWFVSLASTFAAVFFVPLLLLLPLAVFLRSWSLRIAVGGVVGMFIALFGGYFLPALFPTVATPNLRVATFNHLYTNTQIDAIIAELRAQEADIIALQELSPAVADAIAQQFKTLYPYQWLNPCDCPGGLGLLSRYPMQHIDANGGAMKARLSVDGREVTIWNVHLHFSGAAAGRSQKLFGIPLIYNYSTAGRTIQVRSISVESQKVVGPLVIMGDFNTSDREPGYHLMAQKLTDAYRATTPGFGFTFPNNKRFGPLTVPVPLVRIDYVWTSREITPVATRKNCTPIGADHCMLVADLYVDDATAKQ